MSAPPDRSALIVVDVQKGFDAPVWGRRDNPHCEGNVAALIEAWRRRGGPVVFVRHDSGDPGSPLAPGRPGNDFKDVVSGVPDLLVRKSVNSAFHGSPDLDGWLAERRIRDLVVCGITTNHCCETTARAAASLGYDVNFAIDATHTFDRRHPDGTVLAAELLARVTATNLHREFATVLDTRTLIGGPPGAPPAGPRGAPAARAPVELGLPDSRLAREVAEFVRDTEVPALYHHSIRSYLFARALGQVRGLRAGRDYDDELLFFACAMHDVGLTEAGDGQQRFEIDGADLAATYLRDRGLGADAAEVVWDAIALHTTPGIPQRKRIEIALTDAGVSADVSGDGADRLPAGFGRRVHEAYPRLELGAALTDAVVDQARRRPGKAPLACFAGDLARLRAPELALPGWDDVLRSSPWEQLP